MRKKHSVMLIAVLAMILCLTMAFGITAFAEGEEPASNPETPAETVVEQGCAVNEAANEAAAFPAPESAQPDNAPQDNAPVQEAVPVQEVNPTQEATPVQEEPQTEQTTPASDAPAEEAQQNEQEPGQVPVQEADVPETESPTQPTDAEPIQEPVEETAEEPAAKQDEENPAGEEPATPDADETAPEVNPAPEAAENAEGSADGSQDLPGAPAPTEPVNEAEPATNPELKADANELKKIAQFQAADGHTEELEIGSSVDLQELVSRLGYEGKAEYVSSSNPEAFDVVDGQLVLKNGFLDEALTVRIGDQEIVIPMHDPPPVKTLEEIYAAFDTTAPSGETADNPTEYQMKDNITLAEKNLTVSKGRFIILDLNGFVLTGNGSGSVITVNGGTFTLKDSQPNAIHTGEYAKLPTGGIITGGNVSGSGGGVYVKGQSTFNMTGGNIVDNTATVNGGGVCVAGSSSFTMTGGNIVDNTATGNGGGGVCVSGNSSFTMTGGSITENTASSYGGGVYVNSENFTMTGGNISNNTANYGGGVYISVNGSMIVGGEAKITGNTLTDGTTANNLYLLRGRTVSVGTGENAPKAGMSIGVTTQTAPAEQAPVPVTSVAGSGAYAKYFNSDSADSVAVNTDGTVSLIQAYPTIFKAVNVDTGYSYSSVQAVIDGANNGNTIKMLADSTENVTVGSSKNVTLDLNGHVLKGTGDGSVITVNGTFTLNDSVGTGKVTGGNATTGGGVNNDGTFTMNGGTITSNTAAVVGGGVYSTGTFTMTGGSISGNMAVEGGGVFVNSGDFTMTGGSITNNTAGYGGGVENSGNFTMNGGSISQNKAENLGGGVTNLGTFTMTGGNITENTAPDGGGVFVYSGDFTMTGGNISNNTANYGGGVDNYGTFTMNSGSIANNTANDDGGGVENAGTFIMTGGTITGNTVKGMNPGHGLGGGVENAGSMTVGGTASITGNTDKDGNKNNLYVYDGMPVSVNSGFSGAIGVTTESAPAAGTPVVITTENDDDYSACFTSDKAEYVVVNDNDTVKLALPVAAIGETKYASVQDAVDAAASGDTIVMLADSTENVTVGSRKNVTLDLAGHVLKGTGTGSVITVNGTFTLKDSGGNGKVTGGNARSGGGVFNQGTFNMESGSITGNEASGNGGGGVYSMMGTFTMNGGTISNNTANYGGGVYSTSTFTMNGGTITDNTAEDNGGGVYSTSIFTMNGGTITDNTAEDNGGGVYSSYARVTVGGDAKITGNTLTDGTTANNLYLPSDRTVSVGTGVNAPKAGMSIGVTTATEPASGKPVAITANGTAADTKYFSSDKSFAVIFEDGAIKLAVPAPKPDPKPTPVPVVTEDAPKKAIVKTMDNGAVAVAEVKGTTAHIVVEDKNGEAIDPVNVTILEPAELIAMGVKTAEIRMSKNLTVVLDIEAAMCGKANCAITIDNIDGDITVACDGVKICEADFTDIAESIAKLVYDGKTLKAYDAQGNLIREYEIH